MSGGHLLIAWSLLRLGKVVVRGGDPSAAADLFLQDAVAAREHGDQIALAAFLEGLAESVTSVGGLEDATRLVGMAAAVRERTAPAHLRSLNPFSIGAPLAGRTLASSKDRRIER